MYIYKTRTHGSTAAIEQIEVPSQFHLQPIFDVTAGLLHWLTKK